MNDAQSRKPDLTEPVAKNTREFAAYCEDLYAKGAYDQVIEEGAGSTLWSVNTLRMRALREVGRFAELSILARQMLEVKPGHRDTLLKLIRSLRDEGKAVLALREAAKATLLFPADEEMGKLQQSLLAGWLSRSAPAEADAVRVQAEPPQGFVLETLTRMMKSRSALSTGDEAAFDVIARKYQDAGDHASVVDLLRPLSGSVGADLLLRYAGSLQALGDTEEQNRVLTDILKRDPGNVRALEGLRDSALAERDYALAFHYSSALIAVSDAGVHRLVHARIYVAIGCQGYQYGHYLQPLARSQAFTMALAILSGIVTKNPKEHRAWDLLGRLYAHFGNVEKAEAALQEAFRARPLAGTAIELARIQLDAGRIADALASCDMALGVSRTNPGALYLRRYLSNEAFAAAPAPADALRSITILHPQGWTLPQQIADMAGPLGVTIATDALIEPDMPGMPSLGEQAAALAAGDPDRWFLLPVGQGPTLNDMVSFAAGMTPRRSAVWSELAPGVAVREVLIRGRMLGSIMQGIADHPEHGTLAEEVQRRALHLRSNLPSDMQGRTRTAWIVSRYGRAGFGGAEHFMQNVMRAYLDEGYAVEIIGVLPSMAGQSGTDGDYRWSFVRDCANDLRHRSIVEGVDVVHMVGMSYEIVAGLDGVNTRLVYGFHFFRDLYMGDFGDAEFPYFDGSAPVRPESHAMLADLSVVYANSDYSRDVMERSHGMRVPTIYSVSYDAPPPITGPADAILLMNARMDKGFGLLLEMAALLPHRRFVAVASQSPVALAERLVRLRGLDNVTVLDRSDDIDALYGLARVVIVPSFQFVETFSRVVIEAQARGRVVFGAAAGNIPNLIADPDFVLPEDAAVWAARAETMFTDDAAHATAAAAALANAARFGPDLFRSQSRRLVRSLGQRILVGVGVGVGNTLHATPLIRRISEHFGVPVDIVLSEGGRSYFDLMDDPDIVGTIFEIGPQVIARHYDLVFISNCFGEVIPAFNTGRQINSRDFDRFSPGRSDHETVFNLDMGNRLLGIPRVAGDEHGYFVGSRSYARPGSGIIGFHGGSKTGYWVAKRWPHFEQLAVELVSRGFRVVSLGIAEEFVEGTEDWTGGSIGEMADRMLGLDYLVTNDSGVMNIANSLGIPLTAIFGPTDVGTRAPMRPQSRVIAVLKDCAPCEVKNPAVFRDGGCTCIGEIAVDQVLASVLEGMAVAD